MSEGVVGREIHAFWLGVRPYAPTLALMAELFEARKRDLVPDLLLLLEHTPVITLGRGAKAENLLASEETLAKLGFELVETRRGGDVTLHAPGQLVAYPILDLLPDRADVRKYVRSLTEVMRRILLPVGVDAGTIDGKIGLWADLAAPRLWPGQDAAKVPVKLGAIGVSISRWVTQHGFALNLTTDLDLFSLIVPCGIREYGVGSLLSVTGTRLEPAEAARGVLPALAEELGRGAGSFSDLREFRWEEVRRSLLPSSSV